MKMFTHVRDFLSHFGGIADEHAVLSDQITKSELAHLGAMLFVSSVGFWLGNVLRQVARLGGRRMICGERRLGGGASFHGVFAGVDVIHGYDARRFRIMSRR